jgi:hypothetical protein
MHFLSDQGMPVSRISIIGLSSSVSGPDLVPALATVFQRRPTCRILHGRVELTRVCSHVVFNLGLQYEQRRPVDNSYLKTSISRL